MNRAFSRLWLIPIAVGLTSSLVLPGCDSSTSTITLSEDELERIERKAIDALKAEGCKLEEHEDELLGTRGVMVRVYPEHLSPEGVLRPAIVRELRDIRKCFLILDGTPIKPAGLAELKPLGNILLLSAQRTAITDEGLRQIEGIVSVRLLRLNGTRITDDGLRHINRLPNLVMLYLSGTKVTDRGIEQLVILKKLKALQLAETAVTDDGAKHLAEFPDLEFLTLKQTAVTDESVAVLSKLKKLKHVDITDTAITNDGYKSLKESLPECYVTRELTFKSQP